MQKDTSGQTLKKNSKLHRKLREPLKIEEKILALAARLKKKDAPGILYKSTTESISFFNREQVFVVRKVVKISNTIIITIGSQKKGKTK